MIFGQLHDPCYISLKFHDVYAMSIRCWVGGGGHRGVLMDKFKLIPPKKLS